MSFSCFLRSEVELTKHLPILFLWFCTFQPAIASERPSIVVLVHGVMSAGDPQHPDYAFSNFHNWAEKHLGVAELIDFDWAAGNPELAPYASFRVGHRADQIEGQSDRAWQATAKLKELIGRIRCGKLADAKISIVSHSQGTVIALAALQEGMRVDNVVFMGSPLSKELIKRNTDGCHFAMAVKYTNSSFYNFASDGDRIVDILKPLVNIATPDGCIGSRGLPDTIEGLGAVSSTERLLTWSPKGGVAIRSVKIRDVEHTGDRGWWNCTWLEDSIAWPQEIAVNELAASLKSEIRVAAANVKELGGLRGFATGRDFIAKTSRGFGSGEDRDEASWTFHLSQEMTTGFHFDDKDRLEYQLEVVDGEIDYTIKHATWSEWEPDCEPPVNRLAGGRSTLANFKSPNKIHDATLWLRINCITPTAIVRCRSVGIDD